MILSLDQRYKYDNLDSTNPLIWLGEVTTVIHHTGTNAIWGGILQIFQLLDGKMPDDINTDQSSYRVYPEYEGAMYCGYISPKQYYVYFLKNIDEMKNGKKLFTYLEGQDRAR